MRNKEQQEADIRAFLKEYELLVHRYRVAVESCGCCDSPWVVHFDDDTFNKETPESHIAHLREEND